MDVPICPDSPFTPCNNKGNSQGYYYSQFDYELACPSV